MEKIYLFIIFLLINKICFSQSVFSGGGDHFQTDEAVIDCAIGEPFFTTENQITQGFIQAAPPIKIIEAKLSTDNSYLDFTCNIGMFSNNQTLSALTSSCFKVIFNKNTGIAETVEIIGLKKNDNISPSKATALKGGETTIRLFLKTNLDADGNETIEIKPSDSSIVDLYSFPLDTNNTTGTVKMHNFTIPLTSDKKICAGDDVPPLTAIGRDIKWYADSLKNNLLNTGDTFNTNQTEIGFYTYYVTKQTNGTESKAIPVKLSIYENPEFCLDNYVELSKRYESTTLNCELQKSNINYIFNWQPSNLLENNTIQNPVTHPIAYPTLFTLHITDTISGCMVTDQQKVVPKTDLFFTEIRSISDSICYGDSIQLTAQSQGGFLNYNYHWRSKPKGFEIDDSVFWVKPLKTTTYQVVADDNYNTANASKTITVSPLPQPVISGDTLVCQNQKNDIYFTPKQNGNVYQWQIEGGKITSDSSLHLITTSWTDEAPFLGSLQVIEINSKTKCKASSDIFHVNISADYAPDAPEISLRADNLLFCADTGAYTYLWFFNNHLVEEANSKQFLIVDSATTGNYSIQIIDSNNCKTKSNPYFLKKNKSAKINIEKTITIYPNPSDGNLSIEITNLMFGKLDIEIFDSYGKNHFSKKMYKVSPFMNLSLLLKGFKNGIYFMRFTFNDNESCVKKIIIIENWR